jgi:hypothetical protein
MAAIYCIQQSSKPTKSPKQNGSNTNEAVQGRMGQY